MQIVGKYQNIFALGDCCVTPAKEEKTVAPISIQSKIIAENMKLLEKGADMTQLKKTPEIFNLVVGVTLGLKDGILVMNDFIIKGKMAAKVKNDIEAQYAGRFGGDKKQTKAYFSQKK